MSLTFSICQNCKAIILIGKSNWDQLCPHCKSKEIIYNVGNDKIINSISPNIDIPDLITETGQICINDKELQQVNSSKIISLVDIKRNQYIDSRYILSKIKLKVGDTFNKESLAQDVKAIYDLGYFSKVWVSTSDKGSFIDIFFSVEEFPIINNINIKVEPKISPFFVKQNMLLSPGKIMNWKVLQNDLNSINKIYSELGFICTTLEDLKFALNGELSFSINLAKIEKINIDKIDIYNQLGKFNFSLPRIFDYYELEELLLKIYSAFNLKMIHFNLNPGQNKDSVILNLSVK